MKFLSTLSVNSRIDLLSMVNSNYGDRIPALFIRANTARLHYVMGSAYDIDMDSDYANSVGNVGNTRIDTDESLPMGEWTTVTLRVQGNNATLFLNGTRYSSVETDARFPHDEVMVRPPSWLIIATTYLIFCF